MKFALLQLICNNSPNLLKFCCSCHNDGSEKCRKCSKILDPTRTHANEMLYNLMLEKMWK